MIELAEEGLELTQRVGGAVLRCRHLHMEVTSEVRQRPEDGRGAERGIGIPRAAASARTAAAICGAVKNASRARSTAKTGLAGRGLVGRGYRAPTCHRARPIALPTASATGGGNALPTCRYRAVLRPANSQPHLSRQPCVSVPQ